MTEPASPAPASTAADAPAIDSRAGFHAAVRWGVEAAAARDARTLTLVDADFGDWALDDEALLQSLRSWIRRPQRRLVLVAASFDTVQQRFPRFASWHATWAHAVEAIVPDETVVDEWPSMLVDDGPVGVELFDRVHWRGRAGIDARAAWSCRERCDVLAQHRVAGWPVKPLGL